MADEERDLNAAERALGTEGLPGRESAADREPREEWEYRLAPLLEPIPPVEPSAGLFERISERIANGADVIHLAKVRRRVGRWKAAAAAAAAIAAVLAGVAVLPLVQPPPGERYVAIVTSDDDGAPGLVVQFDTESGVATIVPVGVPVPPGNSLQMWHLPEGAEQPYSLGLLPEDPEVRPQLRAGTGDVFAISLEPEGGSPTGQPTQPIYHGTIVRVE